MQLGVVISNPSGTASIHINSSLQFSVSVIYRNTIIHV